MLVVYRRLLIGRSERGQIVIPAVFLFPTLFLFVFLLYETAKLSRVKIRKQFAIDAAAFVEMTNYSDFLNRSAYVNGPFPMRIMHEGFHETMQNCRFIQGCTGSGEINSDELMYKDGAFPRDNNYPHEDATVNHPMDDERDWNIEFAPSRAALVNNDDPRMESWDRMTVNPPGPCTGACGLVFQHETPVRWNLGWEDGTTILRMYVQIYQLLGSVESAQFSVLKRLTSGNGGGPPHNFLQKSYWLNADQTNEALAEGQAAAQSFAIQASGFIPAVGFYCMPKLRLYARDATRNQFSPTEPSWQDFQMNSSVSSDCNRGTNGLFQLVSLRRGVINAMDPRTGGGWTVETQWRAPENYFGVDVNNLMRSDNGPRVRAKVGLFTDNGRASVWPKPNPRFQTRLYP